MFYSFPPPCCRCLCCLLYGRPVQSCVLCGAVGCQAEVCFVPPSSQVMEPPPPSRRAVGLGLLAGWLSVFWVAWLVVGWFVRGLLSFAG